MVGMKQEFRQSQNLVMTQQLQQSIKLLQLSAVELQEYIDEELEKNPLLTKEESDTEEHPAEIAADEPTVDAPSGDDEDAREETTEISVSDSDYSVNESLYDESYGDEWSESDAGRISAGVQGGSAAVYDGDGEGMGIEAASAREQTLREHLLAQVHMDITEPAQRLIAEKLTDMLDEAGYLREDTASLAEELGASKEEIDAVIAQLQQMEPAGVFARSLTECLRLQLADMNRLDPCMEIFLENIEMMASGDLQSLRKKCGVDAEDFTQMIADIRRCNPKPAMGFAAEAAQAVIPDVIVRRAKAGGWHLELNPDALPRVLINRQYSADVGARASDKEAKKFMSEQMANANWLIKALDQRANTILKVASEIVKQQDKFLQHGIRFLKPLVLKDIAAAVGMHESTISRVTTAKFMATPRGTLELKFFFTSSINAGSGQSDFSSKTVMYYIKELVTAEDPKDILSDDAIVKRLKDRNIDVARRTITKYREEMNIPSSVVRRRQKMQEVG
ncbi:MAG: RNA polymerase factor sigma-54 [Pseudomonadota bacterium]